MGVCIGCFGLYRLDLHFIGQQGHSAWPDECINPISCGAEFVRLFNQRLGSAENVLLDLGADKAAAWLGMPQEGNPALGCRGARLLLSRPDLLRTQARAIARAAVDHPIHVVYPMIIDLEQFQMVRSSFEAAVADLQPSALRHGVLFEVPSACLQARQILREADFGCIGTNDLIQYLFAEDRSNEVVTKDSRYDHPALWVAVQVEWNF